MTEEEKTHIRHMDIFNGYQLLYGPVNIALIIGVFLAIALIIIIIHGKYMESITFYD